MAKKRGLSNRSWALFNYWLIEFWPAYSADYKRPDVPRQLVRTYGTLSYAQKHLFYRDGSPATLCCFGPTGRF